MPKRQLSVKRITSFEERKRPSPYITLEKDDKFYGYAMFDPDPELDPEENTGWFQYWDHWYQKGGFYMPCVGPDKCPLCKLGNFPYERAKTLWGVPDDDDNLEPKIFTFNSKLINEFIDLYAEEQDQSKDATLVGIRMRISRTSDQGDYATRQFWEDVLDEKEIDALFDQAPDLAELVEKSLSNANERAESLGILKDDDDDDDDKPRGRGRSSSRGRAAKEEEEEKPARGRGRGRAAAKEEEEEKPARRGRGRAAAKEEEEEEKPKRGRGRAAAKEEESGEVTALDEAVATVVKVDTKRETLVLEHEEVGEFELFFGKDTEIEFDDYEKGDEVLVTAVVDNEGDWVAADAPSKEKKTARRGSRSRK